MPPWESLMFPCLLAGGFDASLSFLASPHRRRQVGNIPLSSGKTSHISHAAHLYICAVSCGEPSYEPLGAGCLGSARGCRSRAGCLGSARGCRSRAGCLGSARGCRSRAGCLGSARGCRSRAGCLGSARGCRSRAGCLGGAGGCRSARARIVAAALRQVGAALLALGVLGRVEAAAFLALLHHVVKRRWPEAHVRTPYSCQLSRTVLAQARLPHLAGVKANRKSPPCCRTVQTRCRQSSWMSARSFRPQV